MASDPSKILFDSRYPIDKIVDDNTNIEVVIGAADFVDDPVSNAGWVAYDVGEDVVASGIFSVDGENYYPVGSYAFGEPSGGGIESLTCELGARPDGIFVRVTNGFLTEQTFNITVYLESVS